MPKITAAAKQRRWIDLDQNPNPTAACSCPAPTRAIKPREFHPSSRRRGETSTTIPHRPPSPSFVYEGASRRPTERCIRRRSETHKEIDHGHGGKIFSTISSAPCFLPSFLLVVLHLRGGNSSTQEGEAHKGSRADKPKRPRKEAPRQTQSKDDPADPAAPNAAAKRSSVYRGVTRYASRHLHAVLPHPIHPLIPIATTALLDPNRNSPRALPALSNQSISDFRTICASSISRPLPSVCNSFRREISACMLHSSIQGRKLSVPVCTASHLCRVLSAKLSLFSVQQKKNVAFPLFLKHFHIGEVVF